MRPVVIGWGVLVISVISSSIGVVYAKHQSRKLFVELQDLRRERDMLDVEWGQLQLEQGALTTHGQVERAARGRLDMVSPAPEDIVIVDP
jgi:cell division protein FtsL